MKKLLIVCAVVLSAGLTSCKKDFVCSCEASIGSDDKYTISNTTKGDAGDTCDNYESEKRKSDPTAACSLD